MHIVFDLDGTVIDSSHRHLSKPDGSIDLEHWIENCTAEKIAADKLLPLVNSMRAIYNQGWHVVICTARVMSEHDLKFLRDNNIPYHGMLSRAEGDRRGDAEMKIALLTEYVQKRGFKSIASAGVQMFDDNLKVIAAMRLEGAHVVNATKENARRGVPIRVAA